MQGQRGPGNSFTETFDLNQGSASSTHSPNEPTARNGMLCPMGSHNDRSSGGWQVGEASSSSSPNLQSEGLGGNVKNESWFDIPPMGPANDLLQGSLSRPLNGSSRLPLNINLNSEHMVSGSDGHLEGVNAFPLNIENNNGASSSSLRDWGSSDNRKALDAASSNCFQHGEQHDFHACHSARDLSMYSPPLHPPSFSDSEELSLRIGTRGGAASDIFPPINETETGESSSRNYGIVINNDDDRFSLPSTRNTMRLSDFFNHHQTSRQVPPSDTFEFRPVSSSTRSQSQSTRALDLPRNMPPFACEGDTNSPADGSSSSAMISAHFSLQDEENSASFTINRREHSPRAHFSEIRNNINLSPENVRNSADPFPSPWATSQHRGSSPNVQRSSQFYQWPPFPSADSESGSWRRSHFPPLRSGSSSLEETMMSSGANQGHRHHTPSQRSSMMMELTGDGVSGWHALAADIEGRQRLVSEIRHVLNAMRRGDSLRDEDYMLFDPFINGIAEFHDRHRDMRLDVDNMSYEELLALEERIGDVSTGLSEEAILRSMKQRKHLCLFDQSTSTLELCSICREEYVLGDDVGELDCGHDFHTDCIKQWLTQKNLCPICKMTALGT